jgi:hypothetical protein
MRTVLVLAGLMAVAAIVLAAIGDGAADSVALGLGGVAGVLAVAAAFYAVGRSEDRQRERERREADRR